MEQMVLLILNDGEAQRLDPLSKNSANLAGVGKVWPEGCVVPDASAKPPGRPPAEEFVPMSLAAFDELPAPRVIKSHASIPLLLSKQDASTPAVAKYIVVTRNPLDACVSCYYHAWNPHKSGWPFDAWAAAWLEGLGDACSGDYFEWHRGWHDCATRFPARLDGAAPVDAPRVLWVHYEELLQEPHKWVAKICTFVKGASPEPALVDKVVEGSSFGAMKAAAQAAEAASRANSSSHLRQGKAGDWRNHFDATTAACRVPH